MSLSYSKSWSLSCFRASLAKFNIEIPSLEVLLRGPFATGWIEFLPKREAEIVLMIKFLAKEFGKDLTTDYFCIASESSSSSSESYIATEDSRR